MTAWNPIKKYVSSLFKIQNISSSLCVQSNANDVVSRTSNVHKWRFEAISEALLTTGILAWSTILRYIKNYRAGTTWIGNDTDWCGKTPPPPPPLPNNQSHIPRFGRRYEFVSAYCDLFVTSDGRPWRATWEVYQNYWSVILSHLVLLNCSYIAQTSLP